jgi:1,4-dihydroxy-2-naphthoyl-CoA hydrolase
LHAAGGASWRCNQGFADTLGAAGTVLNLPQGAGTTTIESKTNFIAAAPVGTKVIGECLPLHRGKSTMVWQTRIRLRKAGWSR